MERSTVTTSTSPVLYLRLVDTYLLASLPIALLASLPKVLLPVLLLRHVGLRRTLNGLAGGGDCDDGTTRYRREDGDR